MAVTTTTHYADNLRAIISWLEIYTGVGTGKVIFLNQETERPAKPYAGILITTSGLRFGQDYVEQTFDDANQRVQQKTSGPRQLVAQVEVYTDPPVNLDTKDAAQMLEDAMLALDTLEVRDAFRAAKIGLLNHTQINRLDEQFNDRWERRAQADITFLYSGEIFDDGVGPSGDWIETVQTPNEKDGTLDPGQT